MTDTPVVKCRNCNGEIERCAHGWRHTGRGGHECLIQPGRRIAEPADPDTPQTY